MSTSISGAPKAFPARYLPGLLVFVLFVVLGIWHSLVVPPFEKPDEVPHYAYGRLLSSGEGLPVQDQGVDRLVSGEYHQAPLYYFLVGRLIAGIDQSDFGQLAQVNPNANVGNPFAPGNKNFMLYSSASRTLQRTNLAVHVGRWFSLLLGAITLLFTYLTARLVFPGSLTLPWIATATVAVIPQFAFISTSFTNDNLAIMLAAAVVYCLARLLTKPDTTPVLWWEWALLGVLLGLAALSKIHVLSLLGLAGLVVLWLAVRRRSWRLPLTAALWILPLVVAIAGWWYWRNWQLYGNPLGVTPLWTRDSPPVLGGFWGEMRGLRFSFWGLFGWFNIALPRWIYSALDVVSLLAVVGLLLTLLQAWRRGGLSTENRAAGRVVVLLVIWALMLIGLIGYSLRFVQMGQGRLILPAIGALGILLVVGLRYWALLLSGLGGRHRSQHAGRLVWILALLPLGLLVCSVYALAILLPRAYHAPAPVATLPADARPVNATYGDGVELVGLRLPEGRFVRGDAVPVTLYLRTHERLVQDYKLFVQLLDDSRRDIANITTETGWGRNPTSLWEPGVIYPDPYEVTIRGDPGENSPLLASVYVGFLDPETNLPLSARAGSDGATPEVVGYVQVAPSRGLDPQAPGLARSDSAFADGIRLLAYGYPPIAETVQSTADGEAPALPVTLLWEAEGEPKARYTAFVHLVGPVEGDPSTGEFVAGFDQEPAGQRFPTQYWQAGDRSLSTFELPLPDDLPPGRYGLWAGLYRSDSQGQERLPVEGGSQTVRDNAILLGTVELR